MTPENQPASATPSHSLAGKVAIVTGASRGIGRAIATLFAAEGAAVVLAARDTKQLEEIARAISQAGGRALASPVDVADEASVAALFAETTEAFGPVDMLVNAAGAFARAPFAEMTTATWDAVLNVNLRGTFLCCREAFRVMPPGGGIIVNFSSLSGVPKVEKFPGTSAYVTSKFGVAGLKRGAGAGGQAAQHPRCRRQPRRGGYRDAARRRAAPQSGHDAGADGAHRTVPRRSGRRAAARHESGDLLE